MNRRYISDSDRYLPMKGLLLIVSVFILLVTCTAAEPYGSIRIESDISSVPVYVDDVYAGQAPILLDDILPGNHLISGSPDGFLPQTRNISLGPGENLTVNFTYLSSENPDSSPLVKIGECIGTPELSNLNGASYDLIHMQDGSLMAYYTGWGESISCMVSTDGILWSQVKDSCLDPSISDSAVQTDPWVFSLPDGGYNMIFRESKGSDYKYTLVSSRDGYLFTNPEPVTFYGLNSSESIQDKPSVPSVIMYPDGLLRVYYHNQGNGIRSAVSKDYGHSWEIEEGSRIQLGTDPAVIILPDGRTGMFYVDLTPRSKGQRIFFSISDNGLDFNTNDSVVVLETTEPGEWLMDPDVEESNGVSHIFFSVMGISSMQDHYSPKVMTSIVKPDCLEERFDNKY